MPDYSEGLVWAVVVVKSGKFVFPGKFISAAGNPQSHTQSNICLLKLAIMWRWSNGIWFIKLDRTKTKTSIFLCNNKMVWIFNFLCDSIPWLPRGKIQTLSVTFTLRTSLKDVQGHSNRTSGDIPTGCPAMFHFCIFTWYLCPLCLYMNS